MVTEVNALRRVAVVVLLAVLAAGCSEDPESAVAGDAASSGAATASPSASPDETAPDTTGRADLPLSENLEAGQAPMWAFPVLVTGWSQKTLDQGGVSQLTKDGGEATFTSYQLVQGDPNGDDRTNSNAYLADFADSLKSAPEVTEVATPEMSTGTLTSDRGALEFVQQDLTYTTTDGTTYRSRYLARSIDRYVLALQYAGPEDDWSEQEWNTLLRAGLSAVLGV